MQLSGRVRAQHAEGQGSILSTAQREKQKWNLQNKKVSPNTVSFRTKQVTKA